jgi:hypothetical protein
MKFRLLIIFALVYTSLSVFAVGTIQIPDSIQEDSYDSFDPDAVLEHTPGVKSDSDTISTKSRTSENKHIQLLDTSVNAYYESEVFKIPAYIEPVKIDSALLQGNPLFIELVFMGYPLEFKFEKKIDFQLLYFGQKAKSLSGYSKPESQMKSAEQIIAELRRNAREHISNTAADVYVMSFDDLPDPNGVKSQIIQSKPISSFRFVEEDRFQHANNRRFVIKKEQLGPWTRKASGMAQFSENFISSNWYQGGNSNIAVLGILTGQLNYDNKKDIQWENNVEWRLGFNSVDGDTTRILNTNDDVLKVNSKLGIKAGGNFFYSGSVDFSTQFFNSYKAVNSKVMKATFLTPVRLNVGMGLDYKYKKLLSLLVSPVSFKYIYIEETDSKKIDPNLFGIKKGENHLSEIGSSFKAQLSYSPFRELQLDSKLTFYTNYEKVEIDWEVVGNFTINRFLSTRISLNPRYDNTVIGQKAYIQFKQLLSFGLSYKLLN